MLARRGISTDFMFDGALERLGIPIGKSNPDTPYAADVDRFGFEDRLLCIGGVRKGHYACHLDGPLNLADPPIQRNYPREMKRRIVVSF